MLFPRCSRSHPMHAFVGYVRRLSYASHTCVEMPLPLCLPLRQSSYSPVRASGLPSRSSRDASATTTAPDYVSAARFCTHNFVTQVNEIWRPLTGALHGRPC